LSLFSYASDSFLRCKRDEETPVLYKTFFEALSQLNLMGPPYKYESHSKKIVKKIAYIMNGANGFKSMGSLQ
jgi:hypothetical protein